jgi:predicted house-cleaning noncanonical NTP pyrophosphatase (MazG superfamily)
MREFQINKLVRDKRVEQMEAEGAHVSFRNLTHKELDTALRAKLVEEAQELQLAEDVTGELADILELFTLIATLHTISSEDIESTRQIKIEKDGEFTSGVYLETILLPNESRWIENFASRPEKYPELPTNEESN